MSGKGRLRYLVLLLALLGASAGAQTNTASLRGVVSDASGPLPGAAVVALSTTTGFVYEAFTNAEGGYFLGALPPGKYAVKVTAPSYKEQGQEVVLLLGQNATINFKLQADAVFAEEITVVGDRVFETRTSQVETNVTREQIELLPQGERNFLNFAALAPGVYVTADENATQTFRSAGMSAKQVNAFVDGLSYKNDLLEGGSFMQDASRGNPFPQNAIQEFQVLTQNYKAEYEKAAAAVISAVTKSGGNEFHGDLLYQFQNKGMITLDDLSKERGLSKPDYERAQAGLSLGGPLVKDRMHFFVSVETNDQDRFNQVFHGPLWNSPNVPAAVKERLSRYETGNVAAPFESRLYFGKLTWQPSTGSLVDLSFHKRDEDERRGFGGQRVAEGAERFRITTSAAVAKWTAIVGRAAFSELTGTLQQMRWFPSSFNATQPRENFIGLLDIGGKDATQDFKQDRLGLREDLSYFFSWLGDHSAKGGFAVNRMDYRIAKELFPAGLYEYRDAEQWRYPFQARLGFGDPALEYSNTQYGIYLQDDWRVAPSLTLSLGLRWDYETNMLNNDWRTPTELLNAMRGACRTYAQPVGGKTTWCLRDFLDFSRYTTDGTARDPYKGMIQPRLGFVWDWKKDGSSVVFGGWGRYFDRVVLNDIFDEKYRQSYKIYSFCFVPGACSNPIPWKPEYGTPAGLRSIIASGLVPGPEVFLVDNDMKPPRSDQWTIGVRQRLGQSWLASVSFASVRAFNGMAWTFADLPPGTAFNDRWSGQVPIPGYARAFRTTSVRKTDYDAVYLTLDRPFTAESNWGFNLAYTYGKADAFGPGTDGVVFALDYVSPEAFDWHPADFDERHRLVVSGTYGLPWGFRASGILTLGSGFPFTIYDASRGWDKFQVRFGAGRLEKRSFLGWGNWVYRSVDLRLDWETAVGRGLRFGLIGEAFNVFNFVNEGCAGWSTGFMPPPGEINAGFGKGECHFNARRYQAGAKVSF